MVGLPNRASRPRRRRANRSHRVIAAAASAGLTVCAISASRASTLGWDTNLGTSGPQGGNGTWVTGGPGWWDGTQNVLWTGTTDVAVFGAPGGTVAITGGVLAGSLNFDASGYVLNGGSISLTAGGGL